MMFWPRKHKFVFKEHLKVKGVNQGFNLQVKECVFCKKTTMLETWQLRRMPLGMSKCSSSKAPKTGLWEMLTSDVDCICISGY